MNWLPGVGPALATLLVATTAAADAPQPTVGERTTASDRNWTGFYGGGYLGDAWGRSSWTAHETGVAAPTLHGTLDFFRPYDAFKGTGSYFG